MGDAWSFGLTGYDTFVVKLTQWLSAKVGVTYAAVPPYFLTDRKVVAAHGGGPPNDRKGYCDRWETRKLQLLLDLPDLHGDKGTLAYGSLSRNAMGLLDNVDQGPS